MSTSGKPLARRRLLSLTGTGAVATATAGVLPSRAYAAATSAPDLGITPGGNATTNRNNLVAALQNSSTAITFPAGVCSVTVSSQRSAGEHQPVLRAGSHDPP